MIHPNDPVEEIVSRKSWQEDSSRREEAYQKARQSVRVEVSKGAFEMGWHARDAEIVGLKHQLQQALAQVEIVDRALGDPGNTSSKVALAAYVQNKIVQDRKIQARLWHLTGCLCESCVINRADDQEEYESRKA